MELTVEHDLDRDELLGLYNSVLLTDDDPGQHALYVSCGYRRTDDVEAASLSTYVRFDA